MTGSHYLRLGLHGKGLLRGQLNIINKASATLVAAKNEHGKFKEDSVEATRAQRKDRVAT